MSVANTNGHGRNELIAADEGFTYARKTNGNPNFIEWRSERHNPQQTGEYGKICEPRLILSNTTWEGTYLFVA